MYEDRPDLSEYALDGEFKNWPRRPTLMAANALYLLASAGMIALGLLLSLARSLLSRVFPSVAAWPIDTVYSVLFETGLLALPVALYARAHPGLSRSMRLNPIPSRAMLATVLAALIGVFVVNDIGTLWMIGIERLGGLLSDNSSLLPKTKADLALRVLVTGMLPGVCEELMFRGFLLGAWERRGTKYAYAVSSVLFALMHGSIEGLPVHLLLSFVLGYLVVSSNSLYVGMIYHTVHNSALLILSYLSSAYYGNELTGYESLYQEIGGASGVAMTALRALILGALFAVVLGVTTTVWRGNRSFERVALKDREQMGWRELVTLVAALLTVGATYLLSLLTTMRVLA